MLGTLVTQTSLQPDAEGDSVSFHGELDVAHAPELRERVRAIAEAPGGRLMLDLSACTFIDSLGVAALVEAAQEMHRRGRVVAVVCRAPQVRRTLSLTGVDEQMPICWTREEALELLTNPHQSVPRVT
jgi:anti-sigma B factor antagonist